MSGWRVKQIHVRVQHMQVKLRLASDGNNACPGDPWAKFMCHRSLACIKMDWLSCRLPEGASKRHASGASGSATPPVRTLVRKMLCSQGTTGFWPGVFLRIVPCLQLLTQCFPSFFVPRHLNGDQYSKSILGYSLAVFCPVGTLHAPILPDLLELCKSACIKFVTQSKTKASCLSLLMLWIPCHLKALNQNKHLFKEAPCQKEDFEAGIATGWRFLPSKSDQPSLISECVFDG